MEVKFSEYRFLRDHLILYKSDEIIPLKQNQALLLDFFLANPDGIHSKDAIMDSVWQNKVVSEQVVFQTISQLRAILGADAIKTFSKKGYKWQLALRQETAVNSEATNNNLTKQAPQKNKRLYWAILTFAIFIVVLGYFMQAWTAGEKIALHLVQYEDSATTEQKQLNQLSKNAIRQGGQFSVDYTLQNKSARQLFAAPKLVWQQSNLPAQEWLLWTETFSSAKGIFLNYGLSRSTSHWHGYLYAETHQQLAKKLSERLLQLKNLGVFSTSRSKLDISTLLSMLKVAPNDADLLLLLANYYLEARQFEVAITYAQKVINLAHDYSFSSYRAKAQWLMAEVNKERRQYHLATNNLNSMSITLADTPLSALKYENISAKAWLAYKQHQFDDMFKILNKGIEFGQEQANALMLFEIHIMYSILARKAGDDVKKYAHLNEAQALLLKHKLDESNFAVVFYHFAIFTQDNNKARPYLEKILGLPRTARNGWIIDHATEMLIDHHIEQQDYALALSLLGKNPDSANEMILLAKVYHAQKSHEKSRTYFEKAFELARLQYHKRIAIDAALMLFKLSAQQPEIQAEYLAYLQRNANKKWLTKQMNILANKP